MAISEKRIITDIYGYLRAGDNSAFISDNRCVTDQNYRERHFYAIEAFYTLWPVASLRTLAAERRLRHNSQLLLAARLANKGLHTTTNAC